MRGAVREFLGRISAAGTDW